MSEVRLYFSRRQGYDMYDLYLITYYDEKGGMYSKISGLDERGMPVLTSYPFEAGGEIEPLLSVSGPFFHHVVGRSGMEEFIESLCTVMNYTPKAYSSRMRILERMVNRVAGSISYCTRHKSFPSENEPCWQCVHQYLDEKREELMADWSKEEEKREEE